MTQAPGDPVRDGGGGLRRSRFVWQQPQVWCKWSGIWLDWAQVRLCVLRGLKRNPITRRRRQANDPVTAAYLYAAIQLIRRHLGPGAIRTPGDAGEPDSVERPLLGFLSQRAVAAEVNHNLAPFHRAGSSSTLRKRWEPQSNFIADVLRFGLWPWHYPAAHLDEVADAKDEVLRGPDPVRGLHRLCYWDLTRMLDTPMFGLGLIAAAEAEGDPVIGEAESGRYRENTPLWKQFYREFLQARGLRLRPGITLDDCADLLGAVADGLTIGPGPPPPGFPSGRPHGPLAVGRAGRTSWPLPAPWPSTVPGPRMTLAKADLAARSRVT